MHEQTPKKKKKKKKKKRREEKRRRTTQWRSQKSTSVKDSRVASSLPFDEDLSDAFNSGHKPLLAQTASLPEQT
jgi:hypothetical protein